MQTEVSSFDFKRNPEVIFQLKETQQIRGEMLGIAKKRPAAWLEKRKTKALKYIL